MPEMHRITKAEVALKRRILLKKYDGKCRLCNRVLDPDDAVLEHDHATGEVRGVTHRGCNTMLARIENARYMTGLVVRTNDGAVDEDGKALPATYDDSAYWFFLSVVGDYFLNAKEGYLHPVHKTPIEKKQAAKTKLLKGKVEARRRALCIERGIDPDAKKNKRKTTAEKRLEAKREQAKNSPA